MIRTVAAFAFLILFAGCGKVAQPHPPFIRIPQPIHDLSANQNGYDMVLAWTNPPRYIDGSPATDLALAIIERDGKDVAWIPSTGAGKAQSFALDSRSWVGQTGSFRVREQTADMKMSESSNLIRAVPIGVPGGVVGLKAVVDQHMVILHWEPPVVATTSAGVAADGYLVSRVDPPEPATPIQELEFKDSEYEAGKTYIYIVTAARRQGNGWVPGFHPESVTVTAVDVTAPQVPTGLQGVIPEKGAYITWNTSEEADLAGYYLYRGGVRIGGGLRMTNSFFDPDFVPGSSYSVSAVDDSGNESPRSAPVSPR